MAILNLIGTLWPAPVANVRQASDPGLVVRAAYGALATGVNILPELTQHFMLGPHVGLQRT